MSPPISERASPAELVARWREDAQVLRRYGAVGRARMLECLAAELESSTMNEAEATADLSAGAGLSGFSRSHLRRLYREGKLIPVAFERDEPLFRVSDLPRKLGKGDVASDQPRPVSRTDIAREVIRSAGPRRRRPG